MSRMEVEVARYLQMTPEGLASLLATTERMQSEIQSMLAAMRRARRIQKTTAKGGKLPQHTRSNP